MLSCLDNYDGMMEYLHQSSEFEFVMFGGIRSVYFKLLI